MDKKLQLKEIYFPNENIPIISFEVFPPKDDADGLKLNNLFVELKKLSVFKPSLISVTYGAGGTNQNDSIEILKRIRKELHTSPMPHFTCVSTNMTNIKNYLDTIQKLEIKNILALRGDIPKNDEICHDFCHADELVRYIKANTTLNIAAACYPEGHKEAESFEKDIFYLKQKVESGAEVLFTQMFFNNDHYFRFIEKCLATEITIPIIPGILPVTSYKQLSKMRELCKVEIPSKFLQNLEKHQNDKDYVKKYGIEFAIKQCEELLSNKVRGIHFYTLNKSCAVESILSNIGVDKITKK